MTSTSKRVRSIAITAFVIAATNYAISFASGVPVRPDAPRPKQAQINSGVPVIPDAPRPREVGSGVPVRPDAPRPKYEKLASGVPVRPDAPRP